MMWKQIEGRVGPEPRREDITSFFITAILPDGRVMSQIHVETKELEAVPGLYQAVLDSMVDSIDRRV